MYTSPLSLRPPSGALALLACLGLGLHTLDARAWSSDDNAAPWLRAGLHAGSAGWTSSLGQEPPSSAQALLASTRAWAIGAGASGGWPVWRDLSLRGDLRWAPTFGARGGAGQEVDGAAALDAGLGLGWTWPGVELYAGAGLTRLRLSAKGGQDGTTGWYTEILPRVGTAAWRPLGPGLASLDLALGGLPSTWSLDAQVGYALGEGAIRPRVGLEASLAGGRETASVSGEAGEAAFDVGLRDWGVGLALGAEWRPSW